MRLHYFCAVTVARGCDSPSVGAISGFPDRASTTLCELRLSPLSVTEIGLVLCLVMTRDSSYEALLGSRSRRVGVRDGVIVRVCILVH